MTEDVSAELKLIAAKRHALALAVEHLPARMREIETGSNGKTSNQGSTLMMCRAIGTLFCAAALEVSGRIFPLSARMSQLSDQMILSAINDRIGAYYPDVVPARLASDIPARIRKIKFAEYARELSLPHLARVIEASATLGPRPVRTRAQTPKPR